MNPSDAYHDLRKSFEDSPMVRMQMIAVALAAMIAAMDGFDVQAMAFVAPVVGKVWVVGRAAMGLLLASSLFGMAGGAIFLSPLADVVGRRPAVLGGLALISSATFLSALSHQFWELAASRALTGLGVGMMVALTNTIAVEFSSARRRPLAVATTIFGFGFGGLAGGLIASVVLRGHPWNWVFSAGAITGAALFVLAFIFLPESPLYLMDRVSPRALLDLNRALERLGRTSLTTLPVRGTSRSSLRAVFAPGTVRVTLRLAIVFMLVSPTAYYFLSWLPQLVADAGFQPSTASLVSAVTSLVGMFAGLLTGVLGSRVRPIVLASISMVCFGLALALLGTVPPSLVMLVLAASICSVFLQSNTASFYATLTTSFPPLARVTGIGLVMGLGRLASGFGPYIAGALFAAGWTRAGISLAFAGASVVGGVVLATGIRKAGKSSAKGAEHALAE